MRVLRIRAPRKERLATDDATEEAPEQHAAHDQTSDAEGLSQNAGKGSADSRSDFAERVREIGQIDDTEEVHMEVC